MSIDRATIESPNGEALDAAVRANHRYYVDTGIGHWTGTFDFDLTDWRAFRQDRIGAVNRILVISMVLLTTLFGNARITSVLAGFPDEQPAGVATNEVRITKWGITVYLLRERYVMHPDGRGVTVDSKERFGPIPFVFASRKAHPAEVLDGGTRAIYYLPLLGTNWIGDYRVAADGKRIDANLSCRWGEASEIIEHVG